MTEDSAPNAFDENEQSYVGKQWTSLQFLSMINDGLNKSLFLQTNL